jgi:flagellar FliJ protein
MKAFNFPLQRVLEVKKIREDIRKKELALALQSEEREWKILYTLQKEESDLKETIRHKAEEVINPAEMAIYHRYRLKLAADIVQQHDKIGEAKKVVKLKRDKLIDASKDKEAMQMLKDKKLDEYKKVTEKEEQEFLDEIASALPGRTGFN